MIVTLTPNPSIDRTAGLETPVTRGGVHRLGQVTSEPGGKGVNVARAIHLAGKDVVAVVPADDHDELLRGLDEAGIPYRNVALGSPVRANLTLTEPDGTTTKLNEPGPQMSPENVQALTDALIAASAGADWAVLSGSLPPGAPLDYYAQLIRALRPLGVKIAIDTSDAPLKALAENLADAAPDLVKPNSEELGQLSGRNGIELEKAADAGDIGPVLEAAQALVQRGVGRVLVTLGGAGALLVTADGAWRALSPKITVKSTVAAGDSALSGFVLGDVDGLDAEGSLRRAVAYGSGAAALPGSQSPTPDQTDPDGVTITRLS